MNGRSDGRVLAVSLSAPEMDHLATELARRHKLAGYVKRYVNKRRWWEEALARTPMIGAVYARTLGRRLPPEGLPSHLVLEAGVLEDISAAILNRASFGRFATGRLAIRRLLSRGERAIGHRAARHAGSVRAVVASYGVALPAFEVAQEHGAHRILNYPIAHHRFQWKLFRDEARRSPEFAAALPRFDWSRQYEAQMDRECEVADMILVGSSFVRDSFVSEGFAAERIRVVPYGVDLVRFRPAARGDPEREPLRILYVGQIGQRKGVGYLLRAYEKFRRPGTLLTLVGDFVAGSECFLPYRDLYRHIPNLPNAQLPRLFADADVFVLPTLIEGMPLVVLEAMACGVPVIVTPNGPCDVVRDGIDGYVVPAGDADALLDRLEVMYSQPELRRQMGLAARRQAERWSWARYARSACDAVLGDSALDTAAEGTRMLTHAAPGLSP